MDSNLAQSQELLSQGQKAFSGGDYVTALRHFVEAANLEPDNLRVGEQIAGALQALGRADEAIQMYKKTAQAYLTQGSIIKAIAVHKAILAINPGDQEVKNQLVAIFGTQIPEEFADVIASERILQENQKDSAKHEPIPKESGPVDLSPVVDQLNTVFAEILGEETSLRDFGRVPKPQSPREAFLRTPLFSDLDSEELNSLIDKVEFRQFEPGEYICREGEQGQELWIIVQGEVDIKTQKADGSAVYLASMSEGDFFGEGGFMSPEPRSASVIAKTPLKALRISRASFDELSSRYPHMKEVLRLFYRNRTLDRVMAHSELFGILPTFRRADLMQSFRPESFKAGEIILPAGEQMGNFYFIESGAVALWRESDVLENLKPGDFFGETMALLQKPATYEARAITETQTLTLAKIDVIGIQQMFPEAEAVLKRVALRREHI